MATPDTAGQLALRPSPATNVRGLEQPSTAAGALRRSTTALLAAGAGMLAVYPLAHLNLVVYDIWFALVGIVALAAFAHGVRRHRPHAPIAWQLLGLGIALSVAGDLNWLGARLASWTLPYPSQADAFYLLSFPAIAAGLLVMLRVRAPGRDRTSLVDAGIATAGTAAVSWVYLVEPLANASDGLAERLVSAAYPLMDVLLAAVAIRMLIVGAARTRAYVFILAAIASQLLGDALYGVGTLQGWYRDGDVVDVFALAAYLFWAAAALEPSMRELTEPGEDPETHLTLRRVLVLAVTALLAPGMIVNAAMSHDHVALYVAAGLGCVIFLLVMVRLAMVAGRLDQQAAREETLHRAAAALVAAHGVPEVERVIAEAAPQLAGQRGARARLVYPRGGATADEAPDSATLFPVHVLGERVGAVAVEHPRPLSHHGARALGTLTAEVELALETAALAADLLERRSTERFRSLVQNSSDLIVLLEPDGTIRYHTPSLEQVLGYGTSLVGHHVARIVDPHDRETMFVLFDRVAATSHGRMRQELHALRADGSVCVLDAVLSNLTDDENVRGIVLTCRDVSERKALEEQLAREAFHDPLTGLPNRALLLDRLGHAFDRQRRTGGQVGVLFIDLEDFESINDGLGHGAGDELLGIVAARLRGVSRPSDTCARLGGDEFGVLLEDVPSSITAFDVARRILASLGEPAEIAGTEVHPAANIGIALGDGSQTPGTMLRNADTALHRAKEEGTGGIAMFEPEMHSAARERLRLKSDLQHAISAHELAVHYQPIVELGTKAIVGFEALARWNHPRRGLIGPDDFIPIAEETGMIVPIGRWVLEQACLQLAGWRETHPELHVNVNLSVHQLRHASLLEDVESAIAAAGIPPSSLTLEITETLLMTDPDTLMGRLESLRALGVKIAIDDFGTGHSSLDYMRRLPADVLKIAKPFTDNLGGAAADDRLMAVMLRLGREFGLATVVEGVEQADQLQRLEGLGCRLAQGFHFARPLDPAGATELLHADAPLRADAA